MAAPPHDFLQSLWYRALEAEIGIAIETDNVKKLQEELYKTRTTLNDPRLQTMRVCLPGETGEVWIVKQAVEVFG